MLEIHEKKSTDGYEKILSLINEENIKIIESFSSGIVDGYGIYSVVKDKITIHDYDGSDLNVIDGIIRTILFKGQFKGINCCEFRLCDNKKYDKLSILKFINDSEKVINDISDFMNNCKKCKEL